MSKLGKKIRKPLVRALLSKETKRKEEYNKLVKKEGVEKIGSFAAWNKRTYEDYRKPTPKPPQKKKPRKWPGSEMLKILRSKKTVRTKAIEKAVGKS